MSIRSDVSSMNHVSASANSSVNAVEREHQQHKHSKQLRLSTDHDHSVNSVNKSGDEQTGDKDLQEEGSASLRNREFSFNMVHEQFKRHQFGSQESIYMEQSLHSEPDMDKELKDMVQKMNESASSEMQVIIQMFQSVQNTLNLMKTEGICKDKEVSNKFTDIELAQLDLSERLSQVEKRLSNLEEKEEVIDFLVGITV